jgi:prepilin-type N-terminal cleavage/methylation domain-containing protein
MKRNDQGFTLIEIVVVLVLISIIVAAVFSHSITADQIDFAGQVDKIKQHIRYAQSLAMKGNDTWGIKKVGTKYWLFHYNGLLSSTFIAIEMPGEELAKIDLEDRGVLIADAFTLFFDHFGVPYKSNLNTPLNNDEDTLEIEIQAISDPSQTRTLIITPETGLIVTQ